MSTGVVPGIRQSAESGMRMRRVTERGSSGGVCESVVTDRVVPQSVRHPGWSLELTSHVQL